MSKIITELFLQSGDIEPFRKSVMALEGDFPFDSASMIDLGLAYFERYPDRFSNRNMEEVMLGYALVRICSVEKMIRGMERKKKESYRALFGDVSKAADIVSVIVERFGKDSALQDHRLLSEELASIKDTVDEIPRGMIKERFIGGISNLFNILYVLKMNIEKMPGR